VSRRTPPAIGVIAAIAQKIQQGRSNLLHDSPHVTGVDLLRTIWSGDVTTPAKAQTLSDTEAIIVASVILGVAWLTLI
jgi:hypothetical protein